MDALLVRRLFDGQAENNLRHRRYGPLRWLAERDRAAIFELLAPRRGERALDVGCGAGLHARALVDAGCRVTAVDFAPRMVERVRPLVAEAHVAQLETLALGARFERVLCSGVLDYVTDTARCFERLAAHVAVGGRLVVTVPRRSPGGLCYRWGYRLVHGMRVRLYEAGELDELARPHHLRLVGVARPFLHSLAIAWTRLPEE